MPGSPLGHRPRSSPHVESYRIPAEEESPGSRGPCQNFGDPVPRDVRVAEEGNYEELMKIDGLFAKLAKRQLE